MEPQCFITLALMISWEDLQLASSLQSAYLLMFSAPASCDWALLDRRAKLPTKLCPVPFDGITRGQEPCSLLCSDANLNTVALSELSVPCDWIWMSLCSSISRFLQSAIRSGWSCRRVLVALAVFSSHWLRKREKDRFLGSLVGTSYDYNFHNLCCPLVLSSQNGSSQRPCAYSSCTLFLKNSIRPGIHFANRKALITRRCKSH